MAEQNSDNTDSKTDETAAALGGKLAGWIHNGRPRWGRIVAREEEKVRLRSANGETWLPVNQLAVVDDGDDPGAYGEAAHARKTALDAETVWRRLQAAAGERLTPAQAARMANEAHVGALWLLLWDRQEYFARHGRTRFRVRDPEEVEHERAALIRKRREQKLLQAIEADGKALRDTSDGLKAWADQRPEVRYVLTKLAYGEAAAETLQVDCPERVERRIVALVEGFWHAVEVRWPLAWFAAAQLHDADPWAHANPRLARHRRRLKRLERSYGAAVDPTSDLEAPQTLLYAVDEAGTEDRDDAIGAKKLRANRWLVEVAVADVTRGYGSDIETLRELADVGTSVYLPTETIPMLPPEIGWRRHSLDDGVQRPVWLLRFVFDAGEDEIVPAEAPQLFRTAATIHGAITYHDIDRGDVVPEGWEILQRLAHALEIRRKDRGSRDFYLPDTSVVVEGGHPVRLEVARPWEGARSVVREWMIQANTAFAKVLADSGYPAPFRTQSYDPDGRAPTHVKLDADPHAGLGVDAYIYATSPIRRLADGLAQRQLLAVTGEAPPLPREQVADWTHDSEQAMTELKQWMGAADRYWKYRYLEAYPETALVGIVQRSAGDGVRVRLEPVGLMVRLGPPPGSGSGPFAVRLQAVEAETGLLELDWATP